MNKTEHNQSTEESLLPLQTGSSLARKQKRYKLQASTVLWRQSPTSLTRDRAPAHRIPKAERFCSTKLDLLKLQQLETLQSERQLLRAIGVSFPRSNRPDHFAKVTATPSPASYFHRLSELSMGKAKTARSLSSTRSEMRSATINHFFNYHKLYMPHSRHRPYQAECTIGNPSPANYTPNAALKGKDIQHSFKQPLKRFREAESQSPGPAAYCPERDQKSNSFNTKGTFPKSRRNYLSKRQLLRSSESFSK